MKYTIVLFGLLITNVAWAETATIPNIFQAGTPARAAEVNNNFSSLKTAVDDNHARILSNTVHIDSYTNQIGANSNSISSNTNSISSNTQAITAMQSTANIDAYATKIGENSSRISNNTNSISSNTQGITAMQNNILPLMVVDHYGLVLGRSLNDGVWSDAFLSSTGYYVNILEHLDPILNGVAGGPENMHYSDPFCTVPAYIDSINVSSDKVKYGYVFTGKNNSILYIQRKVIPVTKNTLGILFQYNLGGFFGQQAGCYSVATANATGTMIPILANDPAITGVPNSVTLPFHIQ